MGYNENNIYIYNTKNKKLHKMLVLIFVFIQIQI